MTDAVIAGQFVRFSSLSDGSLRLVVDVPHEYANDVLTALGFPAGQQVAVALLAGDLVRARSSPAEESQPSHNTLDGEAARPRTPWAKLSRTQQAGIRCADERFVEYLRTRWPPNWRPSTTEQVANAVRAHLGVRSRSEIDATPGASERWDALDAAYRRWAGLEPEARG